MGVIVWTAFTWEAFASILTGVLAVIAAFALGRRQIRIADNQTAISARQADIMERQTTLAELTLRNEIFDRRFVIYEATETYLRTIIQGEAQPKLEIRAPFLIGVERARFLFSQTARDFMVGIWQESLRYRQFKGINDYPPNEDHGPDKIENEFASLAKLIKFSEEMPEAFAGDMKLVSLPAPETLPAIIQ